MKIKYQIQWSKTCIVNIRIGIFHIIYITWIIELLRSINAFFQNIFVTFYQLWCPSIWGNIDQMDNQCPKLREFLRDADRSFEQCHLINKNIFQFTDADTKWPPFCRRHFQIHFSNENHRSSIQISMKFVLKVSTYNKPVLVCRQAIVWTSNGLACRRI